MLITWEESKAGSVKSYQSVFKSHKSVYLFKHEFGERIMRFSRKHVSAAQFERRVIVGQFVYWVLITARSRDRCDLEPPTTDATLTG